MGLVQLRKLKPALSTANKIAETTGLQVDKIKRLLRLADAPEVVQKGVREGLLVTVGRNGKEQPAEEGAEGQRRTLDLLAALEFTRFHEALSKKVRALKNGPSPADKQTGEAIARALKENWELREVKRYVDKIISKPKARQVKHGPGRPGAPFKKTAKQLTIYFDRLDALSATARQSLRTTIEELLKRLATRPKGQR